MVAGDGIIVVGVSPSWAGTGGNAAVEVRSVWLGKASVGVDVGSSTDGWRGLA